MLKLLSVFAAGLAVGIIATRSGVMHVHNHSMSRDVRQALDIEDLISAFEKARGRQRARNLA